MSAVSDQPQVEGLCSWEATHSQASGPSLDPTSSDSRGNLPAAPDARTWGLAVTKNTRERYFTMMLAQVLILASVAACSFGTVAASGLPALPGTPCAAGLVQLAIPASSSIIGRWAMIPPTPTSGPTPTPIVIVLENSLGTSEAVTAEPGASTVDPCAIVYPPELEFFIDGSYTGSPTSLWNGGKYEVLGDGRIRLSTLGNGLSVYNYTLAGDSLTISTSDFDVCQLHYQRAR